MLYKNIHIPSGDKITISSDYILNIPDNPIIPYIQGDGIGIDITPVMIQVINAAVKKAYGSKKKISWMEVFAGEKANKIYGLNTWLPEETIEILRNYIVSIKGPLATPIGGGIRSLNVKLRQILDLYACLRPIRYFTGVPSPVCNPEKINVVIFRENSEDIYAGIEWMVGSQSVNRVISFLQKEMKVKELRFPKSSSIGIKPVSIEGTERLVRKALKYVIDNDRKSLTFVHKGNIMKFTEGGFCKWGYNLAKNEFNAKNIEGTTFMKIDNPKTNNEIIINDILADAFFQQILLRPNEYDVIATLNLNGDYISDALAAQVGGIGISPGANMSDSIFIFEATHGTAPKYAGKNYVNPSSIILSGELMLRHIRWIEAAELIIKAIEKTILKKCVTYDFARIMDNAKQVSCSDFGKILIENM